MDDLLDQFRTSLVRALGYADDINLFIEGNSLPYMYQLMNSAISKVKYWAEKNGLTLSATKTIAVLHTLKTKIVLPTEKLKIGNKEIEISESAKYLGIIIDKKLCWRQHIEYKTKQAKKVLYMLRGAIGKNWGPRPDLIMWALRSVIRPSLTYGCIVWGQHVETRYHDELNQVQRLALLQMGHFRHGTPGAGLEIIAGVTPLHLHIRGELLKARVRLESKLEHTWNGIGTGAQKMGHIMYADILLEVAEIPVINTDSMTKQLNIHKDYNINTDKTQTNNYMDFEGIKCFTKGVKCNKKAGTGYFVTSEDDIIWEGKTHLGAHTTVHEAGLIAIHDLLIELPKFLDITLKHDICIFVGNKSCLSSLGKYQYNNTIIHKIITYIKNLTNIYFEFRYVRAGVEEYEILNILAHDAALETIQGLEPFGPVSLKSTKHLINNLIMREWSTYWANLNQCRQTKIFLPKPCYRISERLMKLTRENLSIMVRWITGHCFLNRHQTLLKIKDDDTCRLCGEDEETPFHIITECPALILERCWSFNRVALDPTARNPKQWTIKQLMDFLLHDKIKALEDREYDIDLHSYFNQSDTNEDPEIESEEEENLNDLIDAGLRQ